MQESISTEFKKDMNDPSTFEFVSMNIGKTIIAGERKKVMNEDFLKNIENYKGKDDWDKTIEQTKREIEFLKDKDNDYEAVYYVDFVARGSNSFGAIIKNNYSATILNDENLTVVHLTKYE